MVFHLQAKAADGRREFLPASALGQGEVGRGAPRRVLHVGDGIGVGGAVVVAVGRAGVGGIFLRRETPRGKYSIK